MNQRNLPWAVLALLITTLSLTSCGAYNYSKKRSLAIQGLPNTDFYLKGQRSYSSDDGFLNFGGSENVSMVCKNKYTYIGSTDATGNGILTLSTEDYKYSKSKFFGIKSGYEASSFKLKKRMNISVIWDIIFPIAFFFDHYTVLNDKKVNFAYLSKEASLSCFEYFDMAMSSTDKKEMLAYFQKAVEQDYRNNYGIKARSLNNMALLYADMGDTHLAYLTLKECMKLNSTSDTKHNMIWLRNIVRKQSDIADAKDAKFNETINNLQLLGSVLSEVGTSIENSQQNYSSSSNTKIDEPRFETLKSNSIDWKSQYQRWERIAEKHYNSLTNLGYSATNSSGKKKGSTGSSMSSANYTSMKKSLREAQREMYNIRNKANKEGVIIPQSNWETASVKY